MPPIEPNRPIDHAGPGPLAEVRLRIQQIYRERALRRIAQLKEQGEQTQLDFARLRETVEDASPSRRALKLMRPGGSVPGPGVLGGTMSSAFTGKLRAGTLAETDAEKATLREVVLGRES